MNDFIDINKTSNAQELENLTFSLSQRVSPAVVWLTTDSEETMYKTSFILRQQLTNHTFTDIHIDDINTKATDDEVSIVNMIQKKIPETLDKSTQLTQVINVFGIEKFISKHQDDAPIIRQLNFERELLYRQFDCNLIIWSDEYTTQLVSQHANDFWDWMTYEFSFCKETVIVEDDRKNIVLIYTGADKEYKDSIERKLEDLASEYSIEWVNKLATEIEEDSSALETSDIILLLISPAFLQSSDLLDIINNLLNQKARDTTVIPIILRPCNWKDTRLGTLEALPRGGEPILSQYWGSRSIAYDDIYVSIENVIYSLTKTNSSQENCIFIWHASQDFNLAEQIFEYLQKRNLKPWLAQYEKINARRRLIYLKQTIDKAQYCIVIVSKNADKETEDMKEVLEYAIEKDNKQPDKIFTISINTDNTTLENFPNLPQSALIPMHLNPTGKSEREIFNRSMDELIGKMTDEAGFRDFETLKLDELKRLTIGAHQNYEDSLVSYGIREKLRPVDYVKAGLYSFANHEYKEALHRFNYALNLGYPENSGILSKMGASLIMIDELKEAEFLLRKSTQQQPTYPLSWYNLGILSKKQQKYEEAIENFKKAAENTEKNNRKYVSALNNQATSCVDIFKLNEAKQPKYLDEAINILEEINDSQLENEYLKSLTYYNLACMYALKGNSSKALKYIRRTLETDPKKVLNAVKEDDFQNLKADQKTKNNFEKIVKMNANRYKEILQNKSIKQLRDNKSIKIKRIIKTIDELSMIINA